MTKEEYLQYRAKLFIDAMMDKIRENNSTILEAEIYEDDHVIKMGRCGIVGYVLDSEGREYGLSMDWPRQEAEFHNPIDYKAFAKDVEKLLWEAINDKRSVL